MNDTYKDNSLNEEDDMPGKVIRLLLVDDQPMVRVGLRMQLELEEDIQVVGEASNGREALERVQMLSPDVVVMDVDMPVLDGIAATEMMRRQWHELVVVIVSIHDDQGTRNRSKAAGAAAFVPKRGSTRTLVKAIRQAFRDSH